MTDINKVEGHKELGSGTIKTASGGRCVSVQREKWVSIQALAFTPTNGDVASQRKAFYSQPTGKSLSPKAH